MRFSQLRRIIPVIFLLLVSVPAAAQIQDVYAIPAVAYAPGNAGTLWVSDFHLMNPQPHELTVTIVFIPSGGGVGDAFDIVVDPNTTIYSDNLLADAFLLSEGRGSLLVAALPEDNPGLQQIQRSFIVHSRAFNITDKGTLGQGIEGAMTGLLDYELDQISALATGVRNFGSPGVGGYRTNVGALNTGRASITLEIVVFDDEGNDIATMPLIVPPQGHVQDALPVQVNHGTIEFFVEDPLNDVEGFVFPYASVVDNRTGDAVYLDPKLLALPGSLFKGALLRSPTDGMPIDAIRPILASVNHRGRGSLARGSEGMRIVGPPAPR